MNDLSVALLITLAGMGLVFAAILLFWGAMALLVRLIGTERGPEKGPAAVPAAEAGAAPGPSGSSLELKRRAALAAVAAALALQASGRPQPFPLPPPVVVNTWLSVMRARQLAQRGRVR